jgi:hypothetical protein
MAYPPPPYADAVCGTPVCGEAICGAWWAYPSEPQLRLGTIDPTLIIIAGDIVPQAGLRLGTYTPGLIVDEVIIPPPAGLRLGTIDPSFAISQLVQPSPAGLRLGAYIPEFIGAAWMTETTCVDLVLATDPEGNPVLLADPETVLALAVAVSSPLVLGLAPATDLDLDPGECL